MKIYLLVIAVCFSSFCYAQKAPRDEAFKTLGALVGGTWTYEGKWPSGESFKQEVKCNWGLNQQIIKVQTYGTIDREKNTHGLRNEGIRAWNAATNQMKFYEFDVFGGITEGTCVFEEAQFHYEYYYEMEGKKELFRDTWKRTDDNTYQFSVSMLTGSEWKVFTSNEYIRIKD